MYFVVRSLDPKGTGQEHWMNRWKPASSEALRSSTTMILQTKYTYDLTVPPLPWHANRCSEGPMRTSE